MFSKDFEITADQARRLSTNKEYTYLKNKIYRMIFEAADNSRREINIQVPAQFKEQIINDFVKVNYKVTELRENRILVGW